MITNKSYYGLIALVHLAIEGRTRHIGVREIALARELPQRFLELLFSRLRAMGIVNSVRGASGGYQLAGKPAEITLREIILACEGRSSLAVSSGGYPKLGRRSNSVGRVLTDVIDRQAKIIESNLDAITLSDVIEQSGQAAEMYWI